MITVHHQLATREEIAERVAAAASRCSFKSSISEAQGPEIRLEKSWNLHVGMGQNPGT